MNLVASMRVGDPRARAVTYDKYADGLHTYCLSLLRHHDAAVETLHATFIFATEYIGELRDPKKLQPWLYAIARNECLRRRSTQAPVAVSASEHGGEAAEALVGLERSLRRAELRSLMWKGAEGLSARSRELLELSVRHSMDLPELAAVLRITQEEAHQQLAAGWKELEWSMTVLHVVEHDRACAKLAGLLDGWDGHLDTVLLRRDVGPHIEKCRMCAKHLPAATGGLDLQVGLPIVAAPRTLRPRVLGDIGRRRLVKEHGDKEHRDIALTGGDFDAEGFPLAYGQVRAPVEAEAETPVEPEAETPVEAPVEAPAETRAEPVRGGSRWRWVAAAVLLPGVVLLSGLLWRELGVTGATGTDLSGHDLAWESLEDDHSDRGMPLAGTVPESDLAEEQPTGAASGGTAGTQVLPTGSASLATPSPGSSPGAGDDQEREPRSTQQPDAGNESASPTPSTSATSRCTATPATTPPGGVPGASPKPKPDPCASLTPTPRPDAAPTGRAPGE